MHYKNGREAKEGSLLRAIAKASIDLVTASEWPEFCKSYGGLKLATSNHKKATQAYSKWIADGEG